MNGNRERRDAAGKRYAFIGQSTIDTYPLFEIDSGDIEPDRVILRCEDNTLEIKIDDPPLSPGSKRNANESFNLDFLEKDNIYKVFGGGAFNSYMGFKRLDDYYKLIFQEKSKITYIDPSNPAAINGNSINKHINTHGNDYYFGCCWDAKQNIVLCRRSDKKIVKNRTWMIDRIPGIVKDNIRTLIKESDFVFVNSGRNEEFMSAVMDTVNGEGKPFYAVITESLTWDFVKDNVMPYGTIISNYDELGMLIEGKRLQEADESDRIDYAFEWIKKIRKDRINTDFDIHVTAGKNGMVLGMVDEPENVYHIKLEHDVSEKIQDYLKDDPGIQGTTGAGDNYSAGLLFFKTRLNTDPLKEAKMSSIMAIMHLGYSGPVTDSDFIVQKV